MFGGDACGEIWARILELSDDETLEWDIFLAPHHCSWSFFTAVPYEENKRMRQTSLDALGKRSAGVSVVASSKTIEDMEPSQPRGNAGKVAKYVVGAIGHLMIRLNTKLTCRGGSVRRGPQKAVMPSRSGEAFG